MSQVNKMLWMGNIQNWMTESNIESLLRKLKIYPVQIILKKSKKNKKYAYLQFLSHERAEEILNQYNGVMINHMELRLDWIKNFDSSNEKIYSVNNHLILIIQVYIGNINKNVREEELKSYFFSRYKSIVSIKLVKDYKTKYSKGYGFIDFSDYYEYNNILCSKKPVYFRRQKIFFTPSNNNSNYQKQNDDNEIMTDLGLSEISTNTNSFNSSYNSQIQNEKNKFNDVNNNTENLSEINDNDDLNKQIAITLKNMASIYGKRNPDFWNSKICCYYCGSFQDYGKYEHHL